jgi:hypothetical protein
MAEQETAKPEVESAMEAVKVEAAADLHAVETAAQIANAEANVAEAEARIAKAETEVAATEEKVAEEIEDDEELEQWLDQKLSETKVELNLRLDRMQEAFLTRLSEVAESLKPKSPEQSTPPKSATPEEVEKKNQSEEDRVRSSKPKRRVI